VPDLEGKPAPGYVVGKASSDPATLEVVGPESAVKRVTEALTEPISIAGAREAVTEVVNVGLQEPAVRLRTPRPATVTVEILPAPVERMLGHRPVHLRNLAANLAAVAEPTSVDVAVRGSRDALARVDPDEVVAFVDLAGLGAGEYVLNVHADSSKEAGVTRIDPAAIKVRITSAK
jgi:YbbR domain-containing protein